MKIIYSQYLYNTDISPCPFFIYFQGRKRDRTYFIKVSKRYTASYQTTFWFDECWDSNPRSCHLLSLAVQSVKIDGLIIPWYLHSFFSRCSSLRSWYVQTLETWTGGCKTYQECPTTNNDILQYLYARCHNLGLDTAKIAGSFLHSRTKQRLPSGNSLYPALIDSSIASNRQQATDQRHGRQWKIYQNCIRGAPGSVGREGMSVWIYFAAVKLVSCLFAASIY